MSRGGLAALALLSAAWLCIAVWLALRGLRQARTGAGDERRATELHALLSAGPALPLLIHPSGEVETQDRIFGLLGIEASRQWLTLCSTAAGLGEDAVAQLAEAISSAAASGSAVALTLSGARDEQVWLVRGGPAPPFYPLGTVLLWFIDASDVAAEGARARTEALRLEQALEALTALIEASPFPMWHRGPDLRLALVNGAYVRAVEADSAAAVIRSGIELVEEADARGSLAAAASVRETGESLARTVPATIGGERRMMRVVEVPLGGTGVAGYAVDVEDREQARAELSRFARAQRDMLDRLSAGVVQFGRDRSLAFFNQPFARLFALKAEWLADSPEFDRLLDSMRESGNLPEVRHYPEWKAEKRQWFTSGLAADEEDWLLPGGKHLRVVAQPLPDGGLLLIFEDRTEQLQLASARDTLLRVRTATFDNLFEAVSVFASDGRLHLWNNRFRELWGFDEEMLLRHPRVDEIVPEIARTLKNPNHGGLVRELVRKATVERKQRSGRVSLIDGRDFEFAAVPLPDGNALFTMLDVTASRVIERALRDRTEALEEADRLKTAFVSNISYELRTPLTSIAGFAEMLAGGYAGELPQGASDYVAAILDSVSRLGTLIDDVLDLTQSDSGGLLLAEEKVDLARLCAASGEDARAAAEAKGLELDVSAEDSAGAITGDRQRLRQALDNIVKNAVAYTDSGGRVFLQASGTASEAMIVVSDNGHGIAAEDQARVFDRFSRTAQRGDGGDAALGLGLPLARQFVEAHGGTVELHSEVEVGTTVVIRLPRKRAPDASR